MKMKLVIAAIANVRLFRGGKRVQEGRTGLPGGSQRPDQGTALLARQAWWMPAKSAAKEDFTDQAAAQVRGRAGPGTG